MLKEEQSSRKGFDTGLTITPEASGLRYKAGASEIGVVRAENVG
jgi:hypothetical protein